MMTFCFSLSCVAQWKSYQESRQTVIELMNEAEKKLTEFSTAKAATSREAEDKLCSHRVKRGRHMNVFMGFNAHTLTLVSSVPHLPGEQLPREAEWFGGASRPAGAGGQRCQQGHHQPLNDHRVAALDAATQRGSGTRASPRGHGAGLEDFQREGTMTTDDD